MMKNVPGWAGPAPEDFCTWARFGTHFIYSVRIRKLDPNFGGEVPRAEGGKGEGKPSPCKGSGTPRVGGFSMILGLPRLDFIVT